MYWLVLNMSNRITDVLLNIKEWLDSYLIAYLRMIFSSAGPENILVRLNVTGLCSSNIHMPYDEGGLGTPVNNSGQKLLHPFIFIPG